ncbi:hypothetical protein O181_086824 [Austropuccinia psidii MF-1]|uniref:Uncharacterized protein n=1 Tax=Austropuccinia psidii MF-1 TaxID=1389203 RepID=A0A9Q3INI3_9BASI|nr:hypothetical protein [Austropuccinia psidii MF-1]
MFHINILRQCGGDLEHAVRNRTTEKSQAGDILDILEEVTTRTEIGSSRINLRKRLNKPWRDSVDKKTQEDSSNMKYKSEETIIKCHIHGSTTYLANNFPKGGKINEIKMEKEPDYLNEENSEDKS